MCVVDGGDADDGRADDVDAGGESDDKADAVASVRLPSGLRYGT